MLIPAANISIGKADRLVVEILNMQNPAEENSLNKTPEVSYPGLPKTINLVLYTKPWGDSYKLFCPQWLSSLFSLPT